MVLSDEGGNQRRGFPRRNRQQDTVTLRAANTAHPVDIEFDSEFLVHLPQLVLDAVAAQ